MRFPAILPEPDSSAVASLTIRDMPLVEPLTSAS